MQSLTKNRALPDPYSNYHYGSGYVLACFSKNNKYAISSWPTDGSGLWICRSENNSFHKQQFNISQKLGFENEMSKLGFSVRFISISDNEKHIWIAYGAATHKVNVIFLLEYSNESVRLHDKANLLIGKLSEKYDFSNTVFRNWYQDNVIFTGNGLIKARVRNDYYKYCQMGLFSLNLISNKTKVFNTDLITSKVAQYEYHY